MGSWCCRASRGQPRRTKNCVASGRKTEEPEVNRILQQSLEPGRVRVEPYGFIDPLSYDWGRNTLSNRELEAHPRRRLSCDRQRASVKVETPRNHINRGRETGLRPKCPLGLVLLGRRRPPERPN